jgi:hypothetical protein
MLKPIALLSAGALLASCLASQAGPIPANITPQGSAGALGNANNNIPFSWTPTSYQQIHDASSFTFRGPQVWTLMRQRMASGFTGFPGQTIDVEIILGHAAVTAATASNTFATNVNGSTEVNVVTRKLVALPNVPNNSWAIAPYPFDTPYVWIGNGLSLRANVYSNTASSQIFTYPLDAWSQTTGGAAIPNGSYSGCKHALGTNPAQLTGSVGGPSSTATFQGDAGYAKAMTAALTIGASDSSWGALVLPFDLGVVNAPGCFVANDVALSLSATTNALGTASWNVSLPAATDGVIFYTQMLVIDPAANGLGLITSNGTRDVIGGVLGVTRIWASISSPSGTVGRAFGMAFGFN